MDPTVQETNRIHIFVTGRVQGVGFRAYVQHIANDLNLVGWVRNRGYYQVESIAEGDSPILNKFLEILRVGPRGARVEETHFEWENPSGEFTTFEVRYR
jgi:acylphosphatase